MKTPFKELLGILLITLLFYFLQLGLNHLNPKDPLDGIEEKIEEVKEQKKLLTEPEKQLEKQATEKEWQEVDKQTDK